MFIPSTGNPPQARAMKHVPRRVNPAFPFRAAARPAPPGARGGSRNGADGNGTPTPRFALTTGVRARPPHGGGGRRVVRGHVAEPWTYASARRREGRPVPATASGGARRLVCGQQPDKGGRAGTAWTPLTCAGAPGSGQDKATKPGRPGVRPRPRVVTRADGGGSSHFPFVAGDACRGHRAVGVAFLPPPGPALARGRSLPGQFRIVAKRDGTVRGGRSPGREKKKTRAPVILAGELDAATSPAAGNQLPSP